MTRRIAIRVEGDHGIGLGHAFRMRALARRLAADGAAVTVLTRPGTPCAALMEAEGVAARGLDEPTPDGLAAALAACGADTVVFDTLDTAADTLVAARRAGARRIVTFEDLGAGPAVADAVVNALAGDRPDDAAPAAGTLFEGPAYTILQPDVTGRIGTAPPAPPVARRLLLAFGGTDTRGLSARVLAALGGLPGPLDIRVNLGPGAPFTADLDTAIAASPHAVTRLRGVPSLAAEFVAAGLVVCAGGVMLHELAALGVPAAAVAAEDHEAATIARWAHRGTVLDLGHHAAFDGAAAARAVGRLLPRPDLRAAMAARGPALVDGQGLERCRRIVLGEPA